MAFTIVAPAVFVKVTVVEPVVLSVNMVSLVAVMPFAASLCPVGGVIVTVIVSPAIAVVGLMFI